MTQSVSLPARVNIAGNPTDAVEGAYATVSCAVPLRGGAHLDHAREWILAHEGVTGVARVPLGLLPRPVDGFELACAAINTLAKHSPEFSTKARQQGAAITTWTRVPESSGLGGSSVLVLAVLAGLRELFDLDRRRHNDYVLAEIAQRAEEEELGITCGFADRYVPLRGGLAYLNYHGKLHHLPLGEEPYVTYEPLDTLAPPLTLVIATTGVTRDSGDVHRPMRIRYLEDRARGAGPMLPIARALGATAWRAKIALLAGDFLEFGHQINENQRLIDQMMQLCGYSEGAGLEVNRLVEAARCGGALGAKLTGAGGGGAIFALPEPGAEQGVAAALRGAGAAEVLIVPVDRRGLLIERS